MTIFWQHPMAKYPPGLRQLAEEQELTIAEIEEIYSIAITIRGRKPVTLEEWSSFYDIIEKFKEEEL